MAFQIGKQVTNLFQLQLSPPRTELMDSLPAYLHDSYASDFHAADAAFHAGRLEATSRGREKYWTHWQKHVSPVGVDPYLQDTHFSQ
jgi:hypothetical protein